MALLRRGSSNISHIFYSNKKAAGGVLDVDMHAKDSGIVREPVENIYWAQPGAGEYRIAVQLYKLRGASGSKHGIPFKVLLQREDEETLSVEAYVSSAQKEVVCFRWVVADDGSVTVEEQAQSTPLRLDAELADVSMSATPRPATRTSRGKGKGKGKGASRSSTSSSSSARSSKGKGKGASTARAAPPAAMKVKKLKGKGKGASRSSTSSSSSARSSKGKGKGASTARAAPPAAMKVKKLKLKAKAKASKPKKESKIAKGKKAKELVWKGLKEKTSTGLKKEHLVQNKFGKVVSAKKSAAAKTNKWAIATSRARKELGFSGFRPLRKGDEFYVKAKEILATL
eukprot:CAMPEP_0206622274 /NCGR_PEP_ID=MMETSP0325_2-20121206/62699_1 /ASSEMBLY_ACC=CAM_ASM_000347 /TAXON_ID=2866 /ORGANISM="Crypthecodinium cohnii, Strain Seligo" /LENGTH=341 /DNA_ID=CAMNT_0054145549 /DNA_START=45 /DNA_END=1070 /DNA_ORIENTATION=-